MISAAIKSYYRGPFTCWTETPNQMKEFWWRLFKARFSWADEHAELVKLEFEYKAVDRLKDLVCKASKAPAHKVTWMTENIRNALAAKRDSDPFKKKSAQCSKNKLTGPKAGTRHSNGCVSTAELAKRLMEKEGKKPTAAALFVKTHTRKQGLESETTFVDQRSQDIYEKYETLKCARKIKDDTPRSGRPIP